MKPTALIAGTLLLLAAAFAGCTGLSMQGDHLVTVEQYETAEVYLTASNTCETKDIWITVFSDLPVELSESEFTLAGAKQLTATVNPVSAEPGLYEVHMMMECRGEITREEFVVKVVEAEDLVFKANAPAVMNIPENHNFTVGITVTNDGDSVLNNIIVFIDEENQTRIHSEELLSLQPGESETIIFSYGARPRGTYTLNYTAVAGEYKFRGKVEVDSSNRHYPVSTIITLNGREGGYSVDYLIKNTGTRGLSNLFLTIEDAPTDWEIISPSVFSLSAGDTTTVELGILTGEQKEADLTLALYEGEALLAEDTLEVSAARLRGTGLVSFGSSFEIGLLVLFLAAVIYLGYDLRKRSKEKNIDVRTLVPDWLETLWPF